MPSRSKSRFIPSGIEICAGNTVAPPSAVVRASVPDAAICPCPMPLGMPMIFAAIDAARDVVEHDIDGGAFLHGLKAVLREHADQRDFVFDNERHRRARLQRPVADRQCDDGDIAVGGRAHRRLRQFPTGVFELRLNLRDRGVDAADLGIQRELGALLRRLGDVELRCDRLKLNLLVLLLEIGVGRRWQKASEYRRDASCYRRPAR